MIGGLPWLLVGLSFLSLLGFAFSGLLVSQAHLRRQKSAQRLEAVAAPYRKTDKLEVVAFRPAPNSEKSLIESAASVFGFNPTRLDQYPVRWWLVLAVSFVVARISAGFLVDFVGTFGLIGLPVIWIVLCRSFFGWVAERRRRLLIQQLPDALAMISRSVRVGVPVIGAMAAVGREMQSPTADEFTRLADELAVGVPVDDAVREMGGRNDLTEYRFFATVISLQAQTGGALTATLDNLADLIRKRVALRERGHALSSEARTSSLILAGLPFAIGGLLWLVNPVYMSVLFTTATGHKILGIAALSLCCGGLTMRSIIKRSLS
jgi:tight adherence protein B